MRVYACMCAYARICMHMRVYACVCVHMRVYACICVYMRVYVHMRVYACIYLCIQNKNTTKSCKRSGSAAHPHAPPTCPHIAPHPPAPPNRPRPNPKPPQADPSRPPLKWTRPLPIHSLRPVASGIQPEPGKGVPFPHSGSARPSLSNQSLPMRPSHVQGELLGVSWGAVRGMANACDGYWHGQVGLKERAA